jgi:hypothetical protein
MTDKKTKPVKTKHKTWTLIDWPSNPSLNLKCWAKSFRQGVVYVGAGDFLTICFSFGANSEDSYSGTRWNYDEPPFTEEQAMASVDANSGYRTTIHPPESAQP